MARSDAALFVLQELGGKWRVLGAIFRILPRPVRDAAYNLVARNRYRVFGKFETCPVPDPRHRHKFFD
jgi:predicted DCC family thiol-disulfide oxidoreductase YuxK